MATIDIPAVTKAANTRPDEDEQKQLGYERDVRKLGSRVTRKQSALVTEVVTSALKATLVGKPALVTALVTYADTGDATQLSPEQADALKKVVTQAREKAENPSQARRIWPRKVAAIVSQLA